MEFFEIMQGQSVQLVRGGPEMIIKTINSQGICCTWFDKSFQRHRSAYFNSEDLRVFSGADTQIKID